MTPPGPPFLDPGVELLPDVPLSSATDDLLGRAPVALRLVELACAAPAAAPRVVLLTGPRGSGRTSTLRLALELLEPLPGVATVALDAAAYPTAAAIGDALTAELTGFFETAGLVDTSDSLRDKLASVGGLASSVARLAGVKVDVSDVLRRSPAQLRAELVEMTSELGKRIVLIVDHAELLPDPELGALLAALRWYAAIPHVTLLLALDRAAVAHRVARSEGGLDPGALERLVDVELALPPAERAALARVVAGGLARAAARRDLDVDPALPLLDPDGGAVADLLETPRDAKRLVNALAAALPLWPADADRRDHVLETALRLLVPELDVARLDARHRLDASARAALQAALAATLAHHPRAEAARAALRALLA